MVIELWKIVVDHYACLPHPWRDIIYEPLLCEYDLGTRLHRFLICIKEYALVYPVRGCAVEQRAVSLYIIIAKENPKIHFEAVEVADKIAMDWCVNEAEETFREFVVETIGELERRVEVIVVPDISIFVKANDELPVFVDKANATLLQSEHPFSKKIFSVANNVVADNSRNVDAIAKFTDSLFVVCEEKVNVELAKLDHVLGLLACPLMCSALVRSSPGIDMLQKREFFRTIRDVFAYLKQGVLSLRRQFKVNYKVVVQTMRNRRERAKLTQKVAIDAVY